MRSGSEREVLERNSLRIWDWAAVRTGASPGVSLAVRENISGVRMLTLEGDAGGAHEISVGGERHGGGWWWELQVEFQVGVGG